MSEARAVAPPGLTTYMIDGLAFDEKGERLDAAHLKPFYLKSEVDALIDTLRRERDEAIKTLADYEANLAATYDERIGHLRAALAASAEQEK